MEEINKKVIVDFVNDHNTQKLLNESYFSGTFSVDEDCQTPLCPVFSVIDNQLSSKQLENILTRACYTGNLTVVEKCLLLGARSDLTDDGGRRTFHSAAAGNHSKIIKMLLRNIPDDQAKLVAINQSDYKGWTPLHLAVCHNNFEATKTILEAGGNIHALLSHNNAPCRTSLTHSKPIHFSAMQHNSSITRLLLSHGANLNDKDDAGRVPLHYACCTPDVDYIKELVALAPKTISLMDLNGRTPLHAAALFGLTQVCSLLLQSGANQDVLDLWDISPANLAFLHGHRQTALILNSDENNLFTDKNSTELLTNLSSMEKRVFSLLQSTLKEQNEDQLLRCIKKLGTETCLELFEEVLKILEQGGQMTANGRRKKTPGGIFFNCVQAAVKNGRFPVEDWIYIRMTTREKEKANKRKNATHKGAKQKAC